VAAVTDGGYLLFRGSGDDVRRWKHVREIRWSRTPVWYNGRMAEAALSDQEVGALEAEMAQVCGVLNAATGRLVALIAKALATGARQQAGICSPGHWVAWRCGLAPARARSLVSMANRLGELPATRAALEAGSLSEDQAAVVCRHAPASTDAEMAAFAQRATVSQLTRSLSRYVFAGGDNGQAAEDTGSAPPEEVRTVSFSHDDDGSWRLSARLPADQGAAVEAALVEARDALFRSGEGDDGGDGPADSPSRISWADALVAMAQSSLDSAAAARPHHQRHRCWSTWTSPARAGRRAGSTAGRPCPTACAGWSPATPRSARCGRRRGPLSASGRPSGPCRPGPASPWRSVTGAAWCPAVTGPGGCRCTTSCTGRTAAPPTRPKGPAQNYLRRSGPMTPTLVDEMRK